MEQTTTLNNLRISNLEYFLEVYCKGRKDHKGAFEVLAELESKVAYESNPADHISIEYRNFAWVMFRFKKLIRDPQDTFVVYDFEGSAS